MNKIYRGSEFQRGYGLGGTFKKFFSWVVPLLNKHAVPAKKSGLTEVGKQAPNTVSDIAKDVALGKSFKTSTQERINSSVEELINK